MAGPDERATFSEFPKPRLTEGLPRGVDAGACLIAFRRAARIGDLDASATLMLYPEEFGEIMA